VARNRACVIVSEPVDDGALARLRAGHDVTYDPGLLENPGRLFGLLSTCDALVVGNRTQVRGEILSALDRCKAVGVLDDRMVNIDLAGCERRRIEIISAKDANARCVAEFALGAAMMLLRGAFRHQHDVHAVTRAFSPGRETGGRTIGILGMDPAGRMLAHLAGNVGMKVIAFDPAMDPLFPAFPVAGVTFARVDEVLRRSDVVSVHLPQWQGFLLDEKHIGQMKSGAVLVAASGGHAVDISALASALDSGHLGGAALDIGPGQAAPELHRCSNVLLAALAGTSVECHERVASLLCDRLTRIARTN
jgi:(S)-sulfolactate dehydrogenase